MEMPIVAGCADHLVMTIRYGAHGEDELLDENYVNLSDEDDDKLFAT